MGRSKRGGSDFPHMRSGLSQYPDKPVEAKQCVFCGRMRRNGVLIAEGTLCHVHDTPSHRRMAVTYFEKPKKAVPLRRRRRAKH